MVNKERTRNIRIEGVNMKPNSPVAYSLQGIYGIGPKVSVDICTEASIDPTKRFYLLEESEVSNLMNIIATKYKVEGALKRIIRSNIQRLINLKTYRGLRHSCGYPVRGQRTHTNAKTRKKYKR